MLKKAIHITHNDSDAIGCALVASIVLDGYDFNSSTYFCSVNSADSTLNFLLDEIDNYEDQFTDLTPKLILITDLSVEESTCDRLEKFRNEHPGTEILGFDHHLTNKLQEKYDWFKVTTNTKISACEFMLDSLLSKNKNLDYFIAFKLLTLINAISRYDTWEWKNNPKMSILVPEDLISVVSTFYGNEDTYKKLCDMYHDKNKMVTSNGIVPSYFIDIYLAIKNKETRYCESLFYKTKLCRVDGKTIAFFINDDDFVSVGCNYLLENYDFIDVACCVYNPNGRISLRTKDESINLGLICQKYFYGGGHKSAAGGTLLTQQIVDLLYDFYFNMEWLSNCEKSHSFPVLKERSWIPEEIEIN